jgi:hypothetical protein
MDLSELKAEGKLFEIQVNAVGWEIAQPDISIDHLESYVIKRAMRETGKTYDRSDIDGAFDDIYATRLENPTILGFKVDTKHSLLAIPIVLLGLSYLP